MFDIQVFDFKVHAVGGVGDKIIVTFWLCWVVELCQSSVNILWLTECNPYQLELREVYSMNKQDQAQNPEEHRNLKKMVGGGGMLGRLIFPHTMEEETVS